MPVLGICYGMQLMTDVLGGEVRRSGHREFGHALVTVERQRRGADAVPRDPRRAARLGEPRRRRGGGAAGLRRRGDERHRADRRDGSAGPLALRAAVSSRGRAHRPRPRDPAELRVRRLRLHRRLDDRLVHRGSDRAHPAQVGAGKVVCGLSGGVDSTVAAMLIHRAIGDRLTCIFVDNGLLRSRRGEPDQEALHREAAAAARLRGRQRPLPRAARRRHRSRAEAEDHRRHVHRRVRAAREGAGRVRLPRTGHALSGRDRVGRRPRAGRRHQEPSQRRRAARAHALQAGRAAARSVQGRSAARRARPRARQGVRRAAAVPGSRPRRARRRRADEGAARPAAAGRQDRRGGDPRRPAGTSGSGRASPCCCRCRASA